jgi:hypothetical protein
MKNLIKITKKKLEEKGYKYNEPSPTDRELDVVAVFTKEENYVSISYSDNYGIVEIEHFIVIEGTPNPFIFNISTKNTLHYYTGWLDAIEI